MPHNGRLTVTSVPVRALGRDLIERMWELYAGHYDHVRRDAFDADLLDKDRVFLGRDTGSGELVGFSTATIYSHHDSGQEIGACFSGDTIILPEYWGQRALHRALALWLLGWKLRHPLTPLYWFLICHGYRTYLTMVRYFPDHWPHFERGLPDSKRALIDSLGQERFGKNWIAERGVVRFGREQPVLRATVAPFTGAVLGMPEIRFFVAVNPGYAQGDELAMIGRVNLGFVHGLVRRLFSRRRAARDTRAPLRRPAAASRP
ncbi:MAG: hypothetical protein ACKVZ0_19105 [Gemmatimonadales bacterium]